VADCDFIIVGGGIAGVSAAARLAALGSVLLLEAEGALGTQASGRSAAMFLENYGNDVVQALNRASVDYLANFDQSVLSPRGVMSVARADQKDAFLAEVAAFDMEVLPQSEATKMVPILNPETVAFAAHSPTPCDLDTDLLLQNFARSARAQGAEMRTGARVDTITHRRGGGWQIGAGGQRISCRILINAAGAWADHAAGLAGVAPLGLQPYRRSMARLPAPGGHDVTDWPMLHSAADDWYAKPDAGKWLVSPSEADPMAPFDAFADDMVIAQGLDRYSWMVTTPVTRVETTWAGLRTFAPDNALVIGFDGDANDFFWLAGQGGYGFQTAAAASALAADLIAGRAPALAADVVAALDPLRFS